MRINPPMSVENLGGKGYQLSLLKEMCLVPDFFVICFDAKEEIYSQKVQDDILKTFDAHAFEYVSVRSSATVEDSNTASFAGVFESKLNVKRDGLIEAAKSVLDSAMDERVSSYCDFSQLDFSAIKMRVIVQKMVNSRVSGVCITKPKKNSETLLLEACLGLGEAVVGGLITPDTYKVNRSTLVIESEYIGFQKFMIPAFITDKRVTVPFFQRNAKKLQAKEVSEIVQICLDIEAQFGYESADIEWAYEGEILYILQSRHFLGVL